MHTTSTEVCVHAGTAITALRTTMPEAEKKEQAVTNAAVLLQPEEFTHQMSDQLRQVDRKWTRNAIILLDL